MDGFNNSLFSDIPIYCPAPFYKLVIFPCPLQQDQIVNTGTGGI